MGAEPAGQRLGQVRDLRSHSTLGQVGHRRRVVLTSDQGTHQRPTRDPEHVAGEGADLDPCVLQHLVDPVDRRGPFVDQGLADRVRSRSSRTGLGGTKLAEGSPWARSWANHTASIVSVFRPGTCLT